MIARQQKTVEIRKTRPKLETPFKAYIYCTTTGDPRGWLGCYDHDFEKFGLISPLNIETGKRYNIEVVSGKIIGEFVCNSIEAHDLPYPAYQSEVPVDLFAESRLSYTDLHRYVGSGGRFYCWHISNLKIYDTPRPLSAFRKACPNDLYCESCAMFNMNTEVCGNSALVLNRPPQSWCYVEEMP